MAFHPGGSCTAVFGGGKDCCGPSPALGELRASAWGVEADSGKKLRAPGPGPLPPLLPVPLPESRPSSPPIGLFAWISSPPRPPLLLLLLLPALAAGLSCPPPRPLLAVGSTEEDRFFASWKKETSPEPLLHTVHPAGKLSTVSPWGGASQDVRPLAACTKKGRPTCALK